MSLLSILLYFQMSAFAATDLQCPEGLWDLGPRRAALGIVCSEDKTTAELYFCKREYLLSGRGCLHIGDPVLCESTPTHLQCEDRKDGYRSQIRQKSDDRIEYAFESSFNSDVLEGKPFDLPFVTAYIPDYPGDDGPSPCETYEPNCDSVP